MENVSLKDWLIALLLIVSLGVLLMSGLTGCSSDKYHVDYCGEKDFYVGAKDTYRAGDEVKLYYNLIATDTEYSFLLDGERLKFEYDEKNGYVISFTMPAHDVKLECKMRNNMVAE